MLYSSNQATSFHLFFKIIFVESLAAMPSGSFFGRQGAQRGRHHQRGRPREGAKTPRDVLRKHFACDPRRVFSFSPPSPHAPPASLFSFGRLRHFLPEQRQKKPQEKADRHPERGALLGTRTTRPIAAASVPLRGPRQRGCHASGPLTRGSWQARARASQPMARGCSCLDEMRRLKASREGRT